MCVFLRASITDYHLLYKVIPVGDHIVAALERRRRILVGFEVHLIRALCVRLNRALINLVPSCPPHVPPSLIAIRTQLYDEDITEKCPREHPFRCYTTLVYHLTSYFCYCHYS